jgi:hypothetical protein
VSQRNAGTRRLEPLPQHSEDAAHDLALQGLALSRAEEVGQRVTRLFPGRLSGWFWFDAAGARRRVWTTGVGTPRSVNTVTAASPVPSD